MSLIKNEIPILEYDAQPRAVLMPRREGEAAFPEKAVFAFLSDEVDRFAAAQQAQRLEEFETITKRYPVYRLTHQAQDICLCQAPLGSAAATQLLDFLLCNGVEQVIATGSCGALVDFPENHWLIPTQALRDEGASYHYLPPSRTVSIHAGAIEAIKRALTQNQIPYTCCQTWTTDGFFRETADMVAYRREEGYRVVEMECAALAACAQFRGATFGQILFTADSLADAEAYDARGWGYESWSLALKLALDSVCAL